jgi:hypothetical protein
VVAGARVSQAPRKEEREREREEAAGKKGREKRQASGPYPHVVQSIGGGTHPCGESSDGEQATVLLPAGGRR